MESKAINKSMKEPDGEPRPSGPERKALCPTTVEAPRLVRRAQNATCWGGGAPEHPWKSLYLGLGLFRGD